MTQQGNIRASFSLSAISLDLCPHDGVPEVAFVGRSNSGKSSALNRLTGNRKLARVSKTPGRTQALNFFDTDSGGRLVDLPGYGYAKASRTLRQSWSALASQYLESRSNLVGLVIVVDCRRLLKPMDVNMVEWSNERGVSTLLLLNKADKLKYNARLNAQRQVALQLKDLTQVSTLLFSAVSNIGVEEARTWIWNALCYSPE